MLGYELKRRIYESLPSWMKASVGMIPFAWIAGKSYRRTIAQGRRLNRASRKEWHSFQAEALKRTLEFVTDQVPAYFELRGTVSRLPPHEALQAFPWLDKETLQRDFERYLPRDLPKIPHYAATTGGSSGNQLTFYLDDCSQSVETAYIHMLWSRIGYSTRSRKATFRGVQFHDLDRGVYWQENPIYNELQLSPFHMNERTLDSYFEQLKRFRPSFLHGYPSAISLLADFSRRREIPAKDLALKGVLLGSEGATPEQRELISETFATRVYSWYGHSERLILAGECEVDASYHHFPDYGVLEIVKEDGELAENEGELGEITGTGLLNRSLPLIRYRTGDRARRLANECRCGRSFDRFDCVEGRWRSNEYVVGRSGSRISIASLNMHGPLFERVLRYQYFQSNIGEMELRVIPAADFGETDVRALEAGYARKTGAELITRVVTVDDIPLTPRGKFIRLIQKLTPSFES